MLCVQGVIRLLMDLPLFNSDLDFPGIYSCRLLRSSWIALRFTSMDFQIALLQGQSDRNKRLHGGSRMGGPGMAGAHKQSP